MNTVLYYLSCLGLVEMLSEWEGVLGALSSSTGAGPWVEGCRQAPLNRVHATGACGWTWEVTAMFGPPRERRY